MKSKRKSKFKSKHKFVKMLMPDEEIIFWYESHCTFVLTNKRFLVHGIDIHTSGFRKASRKRYDYIFPIHTISNIHCTIITKTIECLTVETSGTANTFNFSPGKDQFGNTFKPFKREIIEHIGRKVTEMQEAIQEAIHSDWIEKQKREAIHSDWVEKQKREKNLDKLMKRVVHIHKDEFMAVMGFSESKQFMDWFLNLPEGSPIILKGDIISFKSQVPPSTIKGTQKVQRKSFFCQLDNEQHSATESSYECEECSRSVCADCYDQSRDVGVTKCPYCKGDLHQVQ